MTADSTGARGPVNAAAKVLRTLDALPDHPRLGDLARATELPKSTVHRILQTLLVEGFVVLDETSGHYTPGPRLLGLAGRTLSRLDASASAEPVLRGLEGATGATVHLAVLAGDEAVYVRKLEGKKPYRMVSRVGMSLPLHCTGIGKALLSGMSSEQVRELAERQGLPRRTPATITSADELVAEVDRVRVRGWATDLEENEVGIICVGAGVRDHSGRLTAALSVSQLRSDESHIGVEELGPMVAKAAAELSAAFGAR